MSDPVVKTFDIASLEAFTTALVAAGFEPVRGTNRRRWHSKIHPAFHSLTDASSMDLVLVDGWPYQPPALFVKGLDSNHSTLAGLVCMWREGDASLQWVTIAGLFARIEAWCENAKGGWAHDDLGRDAFLNFRLNTRELVTFDLPTFATSPGGWGDFHGVLRTNPRRIDLMAGRATAATHLRGLWLRAESVNVPPRQLSEFRRCLSRTQRKGLDRALAERRSPRAPSGGVDMILFCWERGEQLEVLVIGCGGVGEAVEGVAMQTGPNDQENLILRAGPDAATLGQLRAVVFGAGALGGHAAVLLAESGLGFLRLVDHDVLTPGNVVRHVAGHDQVGAAKVQAVRAVVGNHAPWTNVECVDESPLEPSRIDALIADADIVIDATGNGALTLALASRTRESARPIVSGALYRGGCVARVRRHAHPDDTPLDDRQDPHRYPMIPPDQDGDVAQAAVSCSAPVNNAPPSSVLACASLIAQAGIDTVTGRFHLGDEIIDVYRPLLAEPPFDRIGRVQSYAPGVTTAAS